jgi:hypothetical protein
MESSDEVPEILSSSEDPGAQAPKEGFMPIAREQLKSME